MLFDYQDAVISNLIIHQIGSKPEGIENSYSEACVNLKDNGDTISGLLKQYFLSPFKEEALFCFSEENRQDNIVYKLACDIFDDSLLFQGHSQIIADHLLENSTHPQIKPGEFYLVLFDKLIINKEQVQCLGIFKSENKETFLKIYPENRTFSIAPEEGINIKKLDKGCLIFNTERENGFLVSIVDKVSKQNEAVFFKDLFLGVEPKKDSFFFTQNYLDLCKNFVENVYNEENDIDRIEQIDLLNRSINYFKNNKLFNENRFNEEVIGFPEIKKAFNNYKDAFESEKGITFDNNNPFTISDNAVKKQNKRFKSVIKLDRNFHVYVHGNHNFIEKGFDNQKGMNYYKLYFEGES